MKLIELYEEKKELNLFGQKINGVLVTNDTPQRVWDGDFWCDSKKLTSLEGAPKEIKGGGFWCDHNLLTSLEHSPRRISSSFKCNENKLTTLKGCPIEIKGNFWCDVNQLMSLEYCIDEVGGNFCCDRNKLQSLEGCPSVIGGSFNCSENYLYDLKDIHKMIKRMSGSFNCKMNSIKSHVLGLLLIDGLRKILNENKWADILNNHIGKGRSGLLAAQAELIEAGLEEYAQL